MQRWRVSGKGVLTWRFCPGGYSYIVSATTPARFSPAFTWHGFQFVEMSVSNWPGFQPSASIITALYIHTNLARTGASRAPRADASTPPSFPAPSMGWPMHAPGRLGPS